MAVTKRVSRTFLDMSSIVHDLTNDLPDLSAGAFAFLICDSLVDSHVVVSGVGAALSCPVWGGTTFTYPLSERLADISAVLVILEMEGTQFSASLSEPLDEVSGERQIQTLFDTCMAGLLEPPKLLIPFIPLLSALHTDLFVRKLFELAGDTPVFGGVLTSDLDSTASYVYADGAVYSDRMVLVALGGNIRPVFSVGAQLTEMAGYAPVVTQADGNVLKKLDDMSFYDYLGSLGITQEEPTNKAEALIQYGFLPCRLEHQPDPDGNVPELRCISYINPDGSATFPSIIPVGTRMHIGTVQRHDVEDSYRRCVDQLLSQIIEQEQDGYQYSILLAVPCVARYFALLGGDRSKLGEQLRQFPSEIEVSSYYGFYEIAPTFGKDGTMHNRSYNASIVMCAI